MPQFENKEIFGSLLRTTINVISRRTSEAYANVVIKNAIEELSRSYGFLKYVHVIGTQYNKEIFDVVNIDDEINNVELSEIGKVSVAFLKKITTSMGKNAGYYFIKEIKEELPTEHERIIVDLGVNFDFLQMDFITRVKESFMYDLENYDIMKYSITVIFEVLNREVGRDSAYKILHDFVQRLGIEHEVLRYVKINDIRAVQGVDIVTVDSDINLVDGSIVGAAIQKVVQEINVFFEEKNVFSFVDKIKNAFSMEYIGKLSDIGVNFDVIKISQGAVVKNVFKALVDVLSEYSTRNYAVLLVNNALKKFNDKFVFLKGISIEGLRLSDSVDGVVLPEGINSVRASELGRALQKTIEDISVSLGEEAGRHFIENFKEHLGKAYLLRIEELGVNLHMIELKRNLLW